MTPAALYRYLSWGADRAIGLGAIAEQANCPRRAVERAIEALRAEGAPICSNAEGTYLSDSPDELLNQYRALRRRAIGQLVNARRLLRTAKAFEKQQQLVLFQ